MKKYIVIGNATEWCFYSWYEEIKNNKNLVFVNDEVPALRNGLARFFCKFHYSQKMNKKINFPGKFIWYRSFARIMNIDFESDDEYILCVYDWSRLSRDFNFFKYLKKHCKNIKIAYLFSNIASISGAKMYGILTMLKANFDYVFAFDKMDAEKYGFSYFPLIYTGVNCQESCPCDVDLFYVGQAKDPTRYDKLIEIFEQAQREKLKCDFNIVGVAEEKQKYKDEISYNKRLPYMEVVNRIKRSRCLVDVIQKDSSGLTIKVCEAVVYGKKLITTNVNVKKEPFYKDSQIHIDENTTYSMLDFLEKPVELFSNEGCQFSPSLLFSKIESL